MRASRSMIAWICACLMALVCAWPTAANAQPPPKPPDAPAAPPAEAPAAPPADAPADTPAPPAPPPPSKRLDPKGAIVVAESEAAQADAKALARAVYADGTLRPAISEPMAQVLVGAPAAEGDAEQQAIATLVGTVNSLQDDDVRRRLVASLASDLGAQLVVVVRRDDAGATARVLRMPDERFLTITLAPSTDAAAVEPWHDAVGILRGLIAGPPPGPRSKPPSTPPKKKKQRVATTKPAEAPNSDSDDWDLLTSPWFWAGLGVVVTVGVTVLVLSQTALNEPDVVMLEGRIGP